MRAGPDGSVDAGLRSAAVRLSAHGGGVPERAVDVALTPSGAILAFGGDVVVKVHRAGTDRRTLEARLRLVGDPALRGVFLAPLQPEVIALEARFVALEERGADDGARFATMWPRVVTVPPDPSAVPWAQAGELLARLHLAPVPGESPTGATPAHGAVARLLRALDGLAEVRGAPTTEQRSAVRVVERAATSLPAAAWLTRAPGRPVAVVHGDWHLGQLGRPPSRSGGAAGAWLLLDPDDVGVGDPAWDFARPAALLAAGLLEPEAWRTLVDAYRGARGPALPPAPADPWPPLEAVARAGVVQGAAAVLRRAISEGRPLDDADRCLVAACAALTAHEEKNSRPNPPFR